MKKLIFATTCVLFASCSTETKRDCTFTNAHVTAGRIGGTKNIDERDIKGCYIALGPDQMGTVEIKGGSATDTLKVMYFKEVDELNTKMLNVKINGQLSEWRKRKGHDIFIKGNEQSDTLAFIFGDRKQSLIKGSVTFTK